MMVMEVLHHLVLICPLREVYMDGHHLEETEDLAVVVYMDVEELDINLAAEVDAESIQQMAVTMAAEVEADMEANLLIINIIHQMDDGMMMMVLKMEKMALVLLAWVWTLKDMAKEVKAQLIKVAMEEEVEVDMEEMVDHVSGILHILWDTEEAEEDMAEMVEIMEEAEADMVQMVEDLEEAEEDMEKVAMEEIVVKLEV